MNNFNLRYGVLLLCCVLPLIGALLWLGYRGLGIDPLHPDEKYSDEKYPDEKYEKFDDDG